MREEKVYLINELCGKILKEAKNLNEDEKRYLQNELYDVKKKIWKNIGTNI